ncbi:MAG: HupE/UreJ family protein [Sediminibacterium sp.]|nr:HupE/UreJ family protein [Sediminibacterium sp.]
MDTFILWFTTGLEHITDLKGYDHILFVSLLVLTYPFGQWGKLLGLITAFTLGHCITLVLSSFNIVQPPQTLTELLIALSILSVAVYHLLNFKKESTAPLSVVFIITLIFGLVHGLGFSFLLKSMLGNEETIVLPLLYFNLGIEAGQVFIIVAVLIFSLILGFIFKWPFRYYKLILVILIGLMALKMSIERLIDLL